MADTGIATRLRSVGLEVREVKGWKTRGRDFAGASPSFNPKGGVNHHTAGRPTKENPIPSLRILIEGRPDLNGPLCNVAQDMNGVFYVIAAGVANHAGLPDGGVCRGMHGNSEAYGLEVEHDGLHALSSKRIDLLARAWAAILRGQDLSATQLVQHWEWAPSRKVDLGTNMHPNTDPTADTFRIMVAREMKRQREVKVWDVSYKNAKGDRVPDTTRDIGKWTDNHPGAFQRGRVNFDPRRR